MTDIDSQTIGVDPTSDPTGGDLPQTVFPEDEFPDPPQDPAIRVGTDGEVT